MNVHPRYHQNCLCLQKKTNRQLKVKIFNTIHVSNSGERGGNGDWAQSPMTTDTTSMPLYWNLNKNPWTLVFRELSGWWTQGGDVRVLGSRGYGGSAHLHSAFALPVSSISLSPSFIFYNNMGTVSKVFPEFSRWVYRVIEHGGGVMEPLIFGHLVASMSYSRSHGLHLNWGQSWALNLQNLR